MDIDKCDGKNCIVKEKCKRFTSVTNVNEWVISAPFKIDKGWFTCELFWGESSELLLEQLKNIMNGDKK
jgi:hypothetical protein